MLLRGSYSAAPIIVHKAKPTKMKSSSSPWHLPSHTVRALSLHTVTAAAGLRLWLCDCRFFFSFFSTNHPPAALPLPPSFPFLSSLPLTVGGSAEAELLGALCEVSSLLFWLLERLRRERQGGGAHTDGCGPVSMCLSVTLHNK